MCSKRLLRRSFVILGAVIACVVIFSGKNVCADGKHFPEKAFKQAPAIPSQRAILVYKDGTEKLTIESALDGQGQEFGWVIPMPSKPTGFEKTSPGLIKTFSLVLQPEIIHDLTRELDTFWRIAAVVTLGSLIVAGTKSPIRILWLVLLFVVFLILFTPTLGTRFGEAAATDMAGVRVHEVRQVGSYELTVLETEDSQALGAWLEDNGFAGLSEEDEKIVSDYIKDEWYFVAAKLRREGDGYSRPHPLSMSFASEKPVYPTRLTATVGSDVYLELYVIADERATCDVLTPEISDTYRFHEQSKWRHSDRIILSDFAGETYSRGIGHPDAAKFMWDGCVLSKLCGTLKPEQMSKDIVLQLKKGEPYRKRYYSRRGARDTGLAVFLYVWCALPVVLALVYHDRRKQPSGKRIFVKRFLVPSVVLSLLVWAAVYAVLPKIDVRTFAGGKGGRIRVMLANKQRSVEISVLAEDRDGFSSMGRDEIAGLLDEHFTSQKAANIFSGEPLRHEDSPGDYTIIEDDRGVVWRTYLQNGSPEDYVVKPSGKD